jgi:TolB-like protein/DNA-binding winged helix-turn-helix (wHTH) protein/Tfp pilus assembly protein PilF
MDEFPSSVRSVRFGVFELDLRTGELKKKGLRIRLQSQPFRLLVTLLKERGEIVTREELRRTLWPEDTFVDFDHSLGSAINKLREALGDSATNPRFIETAPRRGYRFIAPFEAVAEVRIPPVLVEPAADQGGPLTAELAEVAGPPEPERPAEAQPRRPSRFRRYVIAATVFLVAAAALVFIQSQSRTPALIRSLAVLPLENLSGDPSQEYFSDGMTDELITELGRIGDLRVISRTSAMTYKGARKPLPQIARELNVDAAVEGTVLRSGKSVRITAQLILAATDKHLWAESYEVELRDIFSVQKQVARSIAEQVRIKLNPAQQTQLNQPKTIDAEAHEDYLKGRYFWNKRTGDGLTKAVDYFNQAIAKDPGYAQAYTGLADSYALIGDWQYGIMAPKEAYPRAKSAAAKAIALDNTLGEAHVSLAWCLDGFDWDWAAAGKEFTRGIELSPSYATAHHWYGWHLATLGRHSEAVAELEKAESLDPLSLIIGADLAEELLIARRYDEAAKQCRKTMNLDPSFALTHYVLGNLFVQERMYKEGIAELKQAIQASPGSTAFSANLAYAYARSGQREDAVRILNNLKDRGHGAFSNAPEIALVYVGLGDKDQAMAWLEKAYAERFNPGVLLRPCFDPLRSDPRFRDLLRRIGISV